MNFEEVFQTQIEPSPKTDWRIPARGLEATDILRALSPLGPCAIWESAISESAQPAKCSSSRTRPDTSHRSSRYSTIVFNPRAIFRIKNNLLTRDNQTVSEQLVTTDPFSFIQQELLRLSAPPNLRNPFADALGFVSYDAARFIERIRGFRTANDFPDFYFCLPSVLLVLDRKQDEICLFPTDPNTQDEEVRRLAKEIRLLSPRKLNSPEHSSYQAQFSKAQFVERVKEAREYIAAGDVFQVVLANTFSLSEDVDPFTLFDILRNNNPSAYHFLIHEKDFSIVGASPEVMLRSSTGNDRTVKMRLVAGTYAKNNSQTALRNDSKELAEHLMLVDHARNDLGRVSKIGSVKVSDLFSVETYRDVHHLVSQVSGSLKPEENIISALRSCFPIATLSGTPKIRAMEIISELEQSARGVFGGAVVAWRAGESIDSAVAIRSLFRSNNAAHVKAGAGIVWDSDPEREFEECMWKAKALLDAYTTN